LISHPVVAAFRDDRTIRWLSYGCALAIGVLVVLSIFPRHVLLGHPISDDHFSGDIAAHVAGQRAFPQDKWRWPLLWTTMLGCRAA